MNETYVFVSYEHEMTVIGTLEEICEAVSEIADESDQIDDYYLFCNLKNPKRDLDLWNYIEVSYRPKEK